MQKSDSKTSSQRIGFLEAIRGVAAFTVVIHHLVLAFWPGLYWHDRYTPSHPAELMVLPVRWMFDGTFAVSVFFVLSGLVLSWAYVERQDQTILVGGALKRYPRLAVPVTASVLFAYILHQLHLMSNTTADALVLDYKDHPWLARFYEFPPNIVKALKEALWGAFFAYDKTTTYNNVLWTMSLELWGALFVFAFLALTKGTRNRKILAAIIGGVFISINATFLIAFLAGIWLAYEFQRRQNRVTLNNTVALCGCGFALLLGGLHPNFQQLGPVSLDRNQLLDIVGAVILLYCIYHNALLRRLLSLKPLVGLGSISFSLYLFHIPILCSLGTSLFLYLRQSMHYSHAISAGTSAAVVVLVSLAAGRLGYQFVDKPAITVSRRVERWFLPKEEKSPSPAP